MRRMMGGGSCGTCACCCGFAAYSAPVRRREASDELIRQWQEADVSSLFHVQCMTGPMYRTHAVQGVARAQGTRPQRLSTAGALRGRRRRLAVRHAKSGALPHVQMLRGSVDLRLLVASACVCVCVCVFPRAGEASGRGRAAQRCAAP